MQYILALSRAQNDIFPLASLIASDLSVFADPRSWAYGPIASEKGTD